MEPWILPARTFFPGRTRSRVRNPKFFRVMISDAVRLAKEIRLSELRLIQHLQSMEEFGAHKTLGYRSLTQFCYRALNFGEAEGNQYVLLARKMRECDLFRTMIESGELPFFKARKIVTVVTPETQKHWIDLASRLTIKDLEREMRCHKENGKLAAHGFSDRAGVRGEHDENRT